MEGAFLSIIVGETSLCSVYCSIDFFFLLKTNNNAFYFWDIISNDFLKRKPWKYVESSHWTLSFSQGEKIFGLKLTFFKDKKDYNILT